MTANSINTQNQKRQSTYSLLVRSQEADRSIFETAIYGLFILCAIFSVVQFVQQPLTMPIQVGGIPLAATCTADARCS